MGNDPRCDLALRTFDPSLPSVAIGAPVLRCVQIELTVDAGRVVRIRIPWRQVGNIAIGVDLAAADLKPLDSSAVIVHEDMQRAHKGSVCEHIEVMNFNVASVQYVSVKC